jgi:SAM-dependent methyltransferase
VTFKDHFSEQAAEYARFRPRYPAALFQALAEMAPGRRLAWDCGTGNGQAAVGVAGHFDRVVATDASAEQLAHAESDPRVDYRRAVESQSGLKDASVDLVTAAQALHWFDTDRFYAEVRRVLKPGGVVAVWCYDLPRVEPAIDRVLDHFANDTVGPYWAPERQHVRERYRDLPFPFAELPFPSCAMEGRLSLGDLGGYLDTWSSVRRYREVVGADPVVTVLAQLRSVWGGTDRQRTLRWPLTGRVGKREAFVPARKPR